MLKIKLNKFVYNNTTYLLGQQLTMLHQIGKGANGVVNLCKINSKEYAVKICKYKEKSSPKKIAILEQIDTLAHPNITRHYAAFYSPTQYFVIMEYLTKTLFNVLKDTTIDISWETKHNYIVNIALGIKCLHDHNIMHTDIKSPNVLITADNIAKLCDMDSAKHSNNQTRHGTFRYMPPEYFNEMYAYNTFATDIFCFALLAWVIASRREPHANLSSKDNELKQKLSRNEREETPNDCPHNIAKLITLGCLTDKTKRPTIHQCIEIIEDKTTNQVKQ